MGLQGSQVSGGMGTHPDTQEGPTEIFIHSIEETMLISRLNPLNFSQASSHVNIILL